jgi:porin
MAIPDFGTPSNHGLYFAGAPEHNGLYWLAETDFTPKIGPSKLPGRYAAGFIYWGSENTSFFGQNYDEKLLFYWRQISSFIVSRRPRRRRPLFPLRSLRRS